MCTLTQIDFLQSFLFPNDLPLDAAFVREYGVSGPGGRRVLGCYSTTGRLLADAFCEAKTDEEKATSTALLRDLTMAYYSGVPVHAA